MINQNGGFGRSLPEGVLKNSWAKLTVCRTYGDGCNLEPTDIWRLIKIFFHKLELDKLFAKKNP